MSHGNKGTIISSDSLQIDLNEFIYPLKKNKSLNGKPKLFFIQACRGNQKMTVDRPRTDDPEQMRLKYDDVDRKLPNVSDFLFSYLQRIN